METFGENFKAGREFVLCPLCKLHKDSQSESFNCNVLANEMRVNGNYSQIFENIEMHPELISTIVKISKTRNKLLNQD